MAGTHPKKTLPIIVGGEYVKKDALCPCDSGRTYGRCHGRQRVHRASPAGSLELLLILSSGSRTFSKADLCQQSGATRENLGSFLEWADRQRPSLVRTVYREGWPGYQGEPAAIQRFLQRLMEMGREGAAEGA